MRIILELLIPRVKVVWENMTGDNIELTDTILIPPRSTVDSTRYYAFLPTKSRAFIPQPRLIFLQNIAFTLFSRSLTNISPELRRGESRFSEHYPSRVGGKFNFMFKISPSKRRQEGPDSVALVSDDILSNSGPIWRGDLQNPSLAALPELHTRLMHFQCQSYVTQNYSWSILPKQFSALDGIAMSEEQNQSFNASKQVVTITRLPCTIFNKKHARVGY